MRETMTQLYTRG